jgi:hypothetical protein
LPGIEDGRIKERREPWEGARLFVSEGRAGKGLTESRATPLYGEETNPSRGWKVLHLNMSVKEGFMGKKDAVEVRADVVEGDGPEKRQVLALRKPREVAKRARQAASVAVNPESLLLAAVRGKATPETMRAIMDVRRELVAEQARREYYDALTEFQAELEPVVKTRKVKNTQSYLDKKRGEGEDADEVRFTYAPIETIVKKIQAGCQRHGFSHDFDTGELKDGKITITCIIHHVGGHETRHNFPSPVMFEEGKKIGQSALQCVNGAITFGRRVSLIEGYGIMTADPEAEGDHLPKGGAELPRSVEEAQAAVKSTEKRPAAKKPDLDGAHEQVLALIREKSVGKAAERFVATANAHYDVRRADLLQAMLVSLKGMRQGSR